MSRSRHGFAGLLLRHIRARKLQMVLVAALVAGLSFLASAGPRALDILLTDATRHDLAELVPASRDLVAAQPGSPSPMLGADDWAGLDETLTKARDGLPPSVRKLAGKPQFTVAFPDRRAQVVTPQRPAPSSTVILAIDPRLRDHIRLVEGDLPAPVTATLKPVPTPGDGAPALESIDMVLSSSVADAMRWQVGDIRKLVGLSTTDQLVRLSGIYEPLEPDGDFWIHTAAAKRPVIFDDGLSHSVTGTGWIASSQWQHLVEVSQGAHTTAWIPLNADTLRSSESETTARDLAEFTRLGVDMPPDPSPVDLFDEFGVMVLHKLSFNSGTTAALRQAGTDDVSTRAIATMLALGPLLVGGCAIFLAAGLLRSGQRAAVRLTWARGASDAQVRAGLAAQGLLAGLPAAAIGAGVAAVVVPGRPGVLGISLPILVALAPAVALAAMPISSPGAPSARPRGPRVGELLVLGLAVAAVIALRQRGLSTDRTNVDVLLAATPVLLSLIGCVIALRLVGPLAMLIRTRQVTRRGLVGLVGAARAASATTLGLATALALVSGVAVAVFSATTVATLEGGVADTARAKAGADIRVTSPDLSADSVTDIRAIPGVTDASDVSVRRTARLVAGRTTTNVTLIATDAAQLRRVQADVPGAPPIPDALLTAGQDKPLPVVMSDELRHRLSSGDDADAAAELDGVPITVVASATSDLAFTNTGVWLLADHELLAAHQLDVPITSSILVKVQPGKGAQVRQAITQSIKDTKVSTPSSEHRLLDADPRLPGLRLTSAVATGTAAVLVVLTVVMALLGGAEGRTRDVAVARALGMRQRSANWLPVWEVTPLAIVAAAVGVVVGILTPVVALGAVDLIPYTGGAGQPSLVLQPLLSLGLLAAVLALTVVGALASVTVASRHDLAESLRTMED